jgi:hypothetical protein
LSFAAVSVAPLPLVGVAVAAAGVVLVPESSARATVGHAAKPTTTTTIRDIKREKRTCR